MTIQPGEILTYWVPEISAYSACQITHIKQGNRKSEVMYAIIALNWHGPDQPTLEELRDVTPLYINFYFWNNRPEHQFAQGPIPRHYIALGSLPVMVTEEPMSYGSWSADYYIARQLAWEKIPLHQREAFYYAAYEGSQELVEIQGVTFKRGLHTLYLNEYPQWHDYANLKEFPCLTDLHVTTCSPDLLRYLRTNPFIYKLTIEQAEGNLDFTGTAITELTLNLDNVQTLTLSDQLDRLILQGEAPASARIQHVRDGEGITIHYHLLKDRPFLPFSGLSSLSALDVSDIDNLDVGILAKRFPQLTQLALRGAPGYLQDGEQLCNLSRLQSLELYDLFGYSSDVFASAEHWPDLNRLWLSSLPEEVAKQVKTTYKAAVKTGLDLSVRQPRKPEWLKDNLDNPFRSWDGREGITAAQARKAADLFRKVSAGFRTLLMAYENPSDASMTTNTHTPLEQITALLRAYIEGFNKLDRRTGFIYTDEREHILEALHPVLNDSIRRLDACGIAIDEQALWEQMDHWRDW